MHNKPSTQQRSKRKRIENYKRFSKKLKQNQKTKNKKSERVADKPRWFVCPLVTFVKKKSI